MNNQQNLPSMNSKSVEKEKDPKSGCGLSTIFC